MIYCWLQVPQEAPLCRSCNNRCLWRHSRNCHTVPRRSPSLHETQVSPLHPVCWNGHLAWNDVTRLLAKKHIETLSSFSRRPHPFLLATPQLAPSSFVWKARQRLRATVWRNSIFPRKLSHSTAQQKEETTTGSQTLCRAKARARAREEKSTNTKWL